MVVFSPRVSQLIFTRKHTEGQNLSFQRLTGATTWNLTSRDRVESTLHEKVVIIVSFALVLFLLAKSLSKRTGGADPIPSQCSLYESLVY